MEKTAHQWITVTLLISGIKGLQQTGVCDKASLDAGGVASQGELVSTGYPSSTPAREWTQPLCRTTLTGCPECRFLITMEEITLPPCPNASSSVGGCLPGCDHILLYDLNYPPETMRSLYHRDQGKVIISISNRIYVTFCHSVNNPQAHKSFRITYQLTEKYQLITGKYGQQGGVGYFTSPNFPSYYALNHEVYYYHLKNSNPDGFVRLSFDDWILSPNSKLTIHFNNTNSQEVYLTRQGIEKRPFVFSRGPYLYLSFETGEDTIYNHNYVGFNAKYEFVDDEAWPEKPYTVCGEYYYDLYAGNFSFESYKCVPGEKVDCIWVVRKKRDAALFSYHSHVALHLQDVSLVEGEDTLEVREGNYSGSPLVAKFVTNNLTGAEFVHTEAFYIRLTAQCNDARKFRAVFTSFSYAQAGKCLYYYHFLCGNGHCIFDQLRCDGIDHCGDLSDERNCPTKDMSYKRCLSAKLCNDNHGYFCPHELCDSKWDCADGSDEMYCHDSSSVGPGFARNTDMNLHTFIPVSMVTILLAIAACVTISFCVRVKRNRQLALARNQRAGIASTIRSLLPGERSRARQNGTRVNINVEIQHYPDAPPSYNEAVRHSQVMTYNAYLGVCNLGYVSTDALDNLAEPPPYTPSPIDPLPIRYPVQGPLQGQGDLGWAGSGHGMVDSSAPPSYQESVRQERRRRHTNGTYGADPQRRRRRSNIDNSEERPQESRRQRRHRSQQVNRGPSAFTREIFIDAPPWSPLSRTDVVLDPQRPQTSSSNLRDPNVIHTNSNTQPEISILTESFDQTNSADHLPNIAGSRFNNANLTNQRSNMTAHISSSRPDDTQTACFEDDAALKDAAEDYVNRMFALLTDKDVTDTQQPHGDDSVLALHQMAATNGSVHDNRHSACDTQTDTRHETVGTTSHNDLPAVHMASSSRVSSSHPDYMPADPITPGGHTAIRPNAALYNYYDNPVISLSGAADDDTTV